MTFQIQHIPEYNYLDIHYSGVDHLEERLSLKSKIEQFYTEKNATRILIDTRQSGRAMSQEDFINFAMSFKDKEIYKNMSIAVVVKKIDIMNKGVESKMQSLGVVNKLFISREEAIAWLTKR